jgi:hypothetical protein
MKDNIASSSYDSYFLCLTKESNKESQAKKILPSAQGLRFPVFWRAYAPKEQMVSFLYKK